MLNTPKSNPGASVSVLKEAINLCSSINQDPKKAKKQLEEMLEVQKHNSKLLAEVKSELNHLSEGTSKLLEEQADWKNYLATTKSGLSLREDVIVQKDIELTNAKTSFENYEKTTRLELYAKQRDLDKVRTVIDEDTKKLADEKRYVERAVSEHIEKLRDLENRERKLKNTSEDFKKLLENL